METFAVVGILSICVCITTMALVDLKNQIRVFQELEDKKEEQQIVRDREQ